MEPKQYDRPFDMAIDPEKEYFAIFDIEGKGQVTAKLYASEAPNLVNNFVCLARDGYYDGTTFHRVIAGFMAQGGDPTGTGTGGPEYRLADEFGPGLKHSGPGVLSMANSGPNTNGSQFFLTFDATPWLDGKHAIFGQVIQGLDNALKISARDPQRARTPGDRIIRLSIQER